MKLKILFLSAMLLPALAFPQSWTGIIDPTRAVDWTTAGFTIPNFTVPCATQPTMTPSSSGAASANATNIANAIASCDATHNVINVPAGTFWIAGINYGGKSNVVVRGASAATTIIEMVAPSFGCGGYTGVHVCIAGGSLYAQSAAAAHGVGNTVCDWTSGYIKGATTLTFNNCNTPPPAGRIVDIDQAEGTTDNGGLWFCGPFDNAQNISGSFHCLVNGLGNNPAGRLLTSAKAFCAQAGANSNNCLQYSEQQMTLMTGVSGTGTGPYTVTIDPPLYFNDIQTGKNPGSWWNPAAAEITNSGIENLTVDYTNDTVSHFGALMIWSNKCWMRGVTSNSGLGPNGHLVSHLAIISSLKPVVKNNYFYGSQAPGSNSYAVQMLEVSAALKENNIMQNTTSPDISDAVTGSVTAYNFTPYINFGNFMQGLYASHNVGSSFNLIEGNVSTSVLGDDVWGTSALITVFRNHLVGWQPTYVNQTNSVLFNFGVRGMNVIGNAFGTPGYHNQYSVQAASTTTTQHQTLQTSSLVAGSGNTATSIYELGTTDNTGLGNCTQNPVCDVLVASTLMRWGNYDVVNASAFPNGIFDGPESSPAAVPFIGAQTTPGTHTLAASFYLAGTSFNGVTLPLIGPDISSGSQGICSGGTYDKVWNVSGSLIGCTGGTRTASAWNGHVNANPAELCYLRVMGGPPDGSGAILTFNPTTCYSGSPVLVSIAVTPTSATIGLGGTQAYVATGTYSDSSTSNITGSVTWISSNMSVATIASGGLATALTTGSTNITATLGAITSNTAVLTVSPRVVTGFSNINLF